MKLDTTAYTKADLWWILYKTLYNETPKGDYRKRYYYNKACAFDIETTSTVINGTKCAFMYIWMLGIDGYCIIGRTWDEFSWCINKICEFCGLQEDVLLPIYVHNLSYEMQFIKDRFTWSYILALDERKPIYCRANCGIEFRCSYRLSGYSLAKVGENLRKYKVQKMVGDLDYEKIRHSQTPLSDDELGYCVHDVLVVMAYIQECIEQEGSINNIPSTKTGYVRRYVKRECIGTSKHRNHRYRNMIRYLTLEPEEYLQLRECFQGGFTHASPIFSNKLVQDVDSYDFTSSYPAVMLSEEFPMSTSELIEIKSQEEFEYNLENYCCMFTATFYNIESKELFEDYISRSHCIDVGDNIQNNNGRVVKADMLTITITEQDFMIIKRMYSWDKMEIDEFRRYKKGYLPTEFVEAIIKLYEDKTKLKDVKGKEAEYMMAKSNLNSLYGMTVTDIIRDDVYYSDGEWQTESPDLASAIKRYNNSMSRFMFYPWGVWVTAYARVNLWTGIISAGNDYVYSDTDSLKMVNGSEHSEYIEQYNEMITDKIQDAMEYHHIDFERTKPKTIEGKEKPIGVWDYEGHYSRFKTLGAKRYMLEENGKLRITVAGLGKKVALDYILSQDMDAFDFFSNNMYIPKGYAGKMIHTYIDMPSHGIVKDYLGNYGEFNELSSLYMEPADYSLSIGREYAKFLFSVKERVV
jgi:hypothetical protein